MTRHVVVSLVAPSKRTRILYWCSIILAWWETCRAHNLEVVGLIFLIHSDPKKYLPWTKWELLTLWTQAHGVRISFSYAGKNVMKWPSTFSTCHCSRAPCRLAASRGRIHRKWSWLALCPPTRMYIGIWCLQGRCPGSQDWSHCPTVSRPDCWCSVDTLLKNKSNYQLHFLQIRQGYVRSVASVVDGTNTATWAAKNGWRFRSDNYGKLPFRPKISWPPISGADLKNFVHREVYIPPRPIYGWGSNRIE